MQYVAGMQGVCCQKRIVLPRQASHTCPEGLLPQRQQHIICLKEIPHWRVCFLSFIGRQYSKNNFHILHKRARADTSLVRLNHLNGGQGNYLPLL